MRPLWILNKSIQFGAYAKTESLIKLISHLSEKFLKYLSNSQIFFHRVAQFNGLLDDLMTL